VASLEAIMQGKREPLRDYIKRFNKEVLQVRGADESINKYLIAKGLRAGKNVKKVVQLDRPRTFNEFLAIAKTFIRYEEELYADSLNKNRKEGKPTREGKGPIGRVRPLNFYFII